MAPRPAGRGAGAAHRHARWRERPGVVTRRPHARDRRQRPGPRGPGAGRFLHQGPEADRDRPVSVPGGRDRLAAPAARSPVPGGRGHPRRDPAPARRLRRSPAVLVARRPLARVREPAPAGVRSDQQLRSVCGRGPARRRAPAADDLSGAGPRPGQRQPGARLESGRQPDRLRPGRPAGAALLRRDQGGRGTVRRRRRPGSDADARPQRAVAHLLARRALGAVPAGGRPGQPPGPGPGGRRGGRADRAGRPLAHGSRPRRRRPDRRPLEQSLVTC